MQRSGILNRDACDCRDVAAEEAGGSGGDGDAADERSDARDAVQRAGAAN